MSWRVMHLGGGKVRELGWGGGLASVNVSHRSFGHRSETASAARDRRSLAA